MRYSNYPDLYNTFVTVLYNPGKWIYGVKYYKLISNFTIILSIDFNRFDRDNNPNGSLYLIIHDSDYRHFPPYDIHKNILNLDVLNHYYKTGDASQLIESIYRIMVLEIGFKSNDTKNLAKFLVLQTLNGFIDSDPNVVNNFVDYRIAELENHGQTDT